MLSSEVIAVYQVTAYRKEMTEFPYKIFLMSSPLSSERKH